jgi:hypothetical protein
MGVVQLTIAKLHHVEGSSRTCERRPTEAFDAAADSARMERSGTHISEAVVDDR